MEKDTTMKTHIALVTVGIIWLGIVYSMIYTSAGALLTTLA